MSDEVTVNEEMIAELRQDAARIVADAVHVSTTRAGSASLEPTAIISFVALKALLPFVVSATSGLTVQAIRQRISEARTEAKLRAIVNDAIGHQLKRVAPQYRDELLDSAAADLETAGISSEAAREAAIRILMAIESRTAKAVGGARPPSA
jgi:hypothetical protein